MEGWWEGGWLECCCRERERESKRESVKVEEEKDEGVSERETVG